MERIIKNRFLLWILFSFPLVSGAQSVRSVFRTMTDIVLIYIVPFFMTITVAVFIIGVVKFIAASGEVEKRKKAKEFILWGIIILVFLVGFWAVVQILMNTLFGGPPGVSNWPPTVP